MSLWEYKVITSGKGGFATPALLEKFLNDLGRDEWEIVEFRSQPENVLAFSGLARRPTQRDWTLEDAAAAAAKVEAEKLRAEFEAKFKAATSSAPAGGEERAPSLIEEKLAPDDGFRKPVDTSHDDDPDAESDETDDWDKLSAAEEDELPSFFEAIKPHMRRNQRGPGQSVGVDYLAKKWDQTEDDLKSALAECGFEIPEDEDSKPVHVEYEGDLYWLNVNRRGELWINTKDKPRPVFKAVKAQRVTPEEEPRTERVRTEDRGRKTEDTEQRPEAGGQRPEAGGQRPEDGGQRPENGGQRTEDGGQRTEEGGQRAEAGSQTVEDGSQKTEGTGTAGSEPRRPEGASEGATTGAALPVGPVLLDRIRPLMRRNRRGPGGSGSTSFLSRALRCKEEDLKAAFVSLGLTLPKSANEKPVQVEISGDIWWLNADSRGGVWINGREKMPGENLESTAADDRNPELPAAPDEPAGRLETGSTGEALAPEAAATAGTDPATGAPAPVSGGVLAGVRLLLKATKSGAVAARIDRLADDLGKPVEELLATLTGVGLKVPEKPRERSVFVEHAGESFWINRNAKNELWLNAKESKFAEKKDEGTGSSDGAEGAATAEDGETAGEKKPRRPRSRKSSN